MYLQCKKLNNMNTLSSLPKQVYVTQLQNHLGKVILLFNDILKKIMNKYLYMTKFNMKFMHSHIFCPIFQYFHFLFQNSSMVVIIVILLLYSFTILLVVCIYSFSQLLGTFSFLFEILLFSKDLSILGFTVNVSIPQ